LRAIRESRGFTQEELSQATKVGLATIQRYEKGSRAKSEIIVILARFLHVSADYLLGLTDESAPDFQRELTTEEQALLDAFHKGDAARIMRLFVDDHVKTP